ncbi:hypothetical protein NNRS527_00107 [Nitrosospira sp. NRS527]|nr:hypothetical protein NNRS527_00107 [Nitrosospira sp. NRS527]
MVDCSMTRLHKVYDKVEFSIKWTIGSDAADAMPASTLHLMKI